MSSMIDICNMALAHAGISKRIMNIDEASQEAKACKQFYTQSLQSLLCEFEWNFACGYEQLALTTNTHPGYEYVYAYPSKVLRVNRIYTEDDFNTPGRSEGWKFQIEHFSGGKAIVTNASLALAFCTYEVKEQEFTPEFTEALAYKIACEIICTLTGGNVSTKQALYQLYNAKLSEARTLCANEERQLIDDFEYDLYNRVRR